MFKWAYLIVFLILSAYAIDFSVDDSGSSFGDFLPIIATIFAFIFASITFLKWRNVYRDSKTKYSRIFMVLPVLAVVIFALCSLATYRKINKPYHLLATLPGDHNYHYYFRNDSTLKIIGHFALGDCQTFQSYQMRGDTILLDSILPYTGIAARQYLFTISRDSRHKTLTPITESGEKIDSLSLYVENKNYR